MGGISTKSGHTHCHLLVNKFLNVNEIFNLLKDLVEENQ